MSNLSQSSRYTTHRPICALCKQELEPCESERGGVSVYSGFHPCPHHPRGPVYYPEIPQPKLNV